MRIASLKPDGLAIIRDDAYISIGEALAQQGKLPRGATMEDLMANYDALKPAIEQAAQSGTRIPADPKRLAAPVAKPSKIWAAAGNYKRGGSGIEGGAGRGAASTVSPEALLEQAFMKPPTAVIGPEEAIVIPPGVDTVFPELELCVVIGKNARNVSRQQALDYVFGYTIMIDVTARNASSVQQGLTGSRSVRKGYETFAPIGPWITTRDEIANPQGLEMRLWVNDDLVQSATTEAMINGVAELVSYLSGVGTLNPGDLITTGNPDSPEFQRKLEPGDTLKCEIERIGVMNLSVRSA
jgi:2-keto-4-pentenoate hydratase/2-oxohepta-3-ene-1,7-dioic acid hydratase in catechol pathway